MKEAAFRHGLQEVEGLVVAPDEERRDRPMPVQQRVVAQGSISLGHRQVGQIPLIPDRLGITHLEHQVERCLGMEFQDGLPKGDPLAVNIAKNCDAHRCLAC